MLAESGLQFSKGKDTKGALSLIGGLGAGAGGVGGAFGALGGVGGTAGGVAGGGGASGGGLLGPAGFGGVGGGTGAGFPGLTSLGPSMGLGSGGLGAGFAGGLPIGGANDFLSPNALSSGLGSGGLGAGFAGGSPMGGANDFSSPGNFDLVNALKGTGKGLNTLSQGSQGLGGGGTNNQDPTYDKEAAERAERERQARLRLADELYRSFLARRLQMQGEMDQRRKTLASNRTSLAERLTTAAGA